MLGTGTEIFEVQEWAMLAEREIIHEGFEGYKAGSAGGGGDVKSIRPRIFILCLPSWRRESFRLLYGSLSLVQVIRSLVGDFNCISRLSVLTF